MKDYYKILVINRNAGSGEIKKAYRALALKWHPDVNKDIGAEDVFIEINEAYEILNNDSKRKAYDALYSEYINSINVINLMDYSNDKFTSFNLWSKEARRTAYSRSKMPYSEFAKTVGKVYEGASNGCAIIFAIVLWIAWGPVGLISLTQGAVDMVRDFPEHGFKTRYIFLVLFLLFCFVITLIGIIGIFAYGKKLLNDLNR